MQKLSALLLILVMLFATAQNTHASYKSGQFARIFLHNPNLDTDNFSNYDLVFQNPYSYVGTYALRQINQNGIFLTYNSALSVYSSPRKDSFNYELINSNHPEWIVTDNAGNRVVWPGTSSRYYLDITNQEFQQWAAAQLTQKVQEIENQNSGLVDGVGLDNVLLRVPQPLVGVYTRQEWHNGWKAYLAVLHSRLNAVGYILVANINANYYSSTFQQDYGDIFDAVDGYIHEGFLSTLDTSGYRAIPERLWRNLIENHIYLTTVKEKRGVFISYNADNTINDRIYLYASNLLISNSNSYYAYSPLYLAGSDLAYTNNYRWDMLWDIEIGTPIGHMYSRQNTMQRNFTNGKVIVNPSNSNHTINLEKKYYLINGTATTRIDLDPKSAQILLNFPYEEQQYPTFFSDDFSKDNDNDGIPDNWLHFDYRVVGKKTLDRGSWKWEKFKSQSLVGAYSKPFAVSPDTKYSLAAWIKSRNGIEPVYLGWEEFDKNLYPSNAEGPPNTHSSNSTTYFILNNRPVSTDWREYAAELKPKYPNTKYIRIRMFVRLNNETDAVWWDNVSFCPISDSKCQSSNSTIFNLFAWRRLWAGGETGADANGDGKTNILDYLTLLKGWLK